jgi:hypothetical protein
MNKTEMTITVSLVSVVCGIFVFGSEPKRLVPEVPPAKMTEFNFDETVVQGENIDVSEWVNSLVSLFPEGCPTIYSSWHVERLKSEEKVEDFKNTKAGREFGKLVLIKLDQVCALVVAGDLSTQTLQSIALSLTDLSDWFRGGQGNGNIVIATRSRAVACLAMSYLVVDLDYPIVEFETILSKIEAYDKLAYIRDYVVSIDRESEGLFAAMVFEGADTNATEMIFFEARHNLMQTPRIRDRESIRKARLTYERLAASQIDDVGIKGGTTELWDVFYQAAPDMFHFKLMWDLRKVLIFRKEVGGFPLRPLPKNTYKNGKIHPFYQNETRAAFSLAWDKFYKGLEEEDERKRNYFNMNPNATAARVFLAVADNNFKDYPLLGNITKEK